MAKFAEQAERYEEMMEVLLPSSPSSRIHLP